MNSRLHRLLKVGRLLLAVFLLASQALLAAHGLQHLGPAEDTPCAVCSVGHNLQGVTEVAQSTPIEPTEAPHDPALPATDPSHPVYRSNAARAPPALA